ncbi:spore germination protein [Virgibacillus ainsalahensis]
MKSGLGNSSDIVVRELYIDKDHQLKAAIFYTDGLVDGEALRDLMNAVSVSFSSVESASQDSIRQNIVEVLKNKSLSAGNIKYIHYVKDLFSSILTGSTVILIDGHTTGLSVSTEGGEKRAITQPTADQAVRGSQEGFTEAIRTNTSLIRRKIKNPDLWLETTQVGTATQTDVAIMYMNGIADGKIVEEVRRRLDRINMDRP